MTEIGVSVAERPRAGASALVRAFRLRRTQIGTALVAVILAVAILGPVIAAHGPTEVVGSPFQAAGEGAPLGTDYLGRDVLSRVLNGGRSVVWMSLLAATLGVGAGVALGMVAGYVGGRVDELIMRMLDIVLAFPGLILALLFVSMLGSRAWLIVLIVALGWIPGVARVARGISADLAGREFVVAAKIAGARRRQVVLRELLPNLVMIAVVEFGLRLTWSIAAIAALSFLGLGIQPPVADWGLMMNENRNGLAIQPWAVMMPAILVAALTVGTNLVAEGLGRTIARIDVR